MSSESSVANPPQKLENIDEDNVANWLPTSVAPPDTPTEIMEFLSRSWSLSAKELSKALSNPSATTTPIDLRMTTDVDASRDERDTEDSMPVMEPAEYYKSLPHENSPPRSPRGSEETKLHAAVSVAGVASAVAAITASNVIPEETSNRQANRTSSIPAAVASAAALVASHCIEIAEDMGADNHQILSLVNSAITAKTNGDIMTLTAGAATALRGAATLKARLQSGFGPATVLADEDVEDGKEPKLKTLKFVSKGGELLKRTREGALHWKQVSFSINSTFQVVVKLKSKHMAGTFTKKKKFVVSGVYSEVPAWPGRDREDPMGQKSYFGIQIADRIIEFECKSKGEKQMWIDGIQHMLNSRINMT